MSYSNKDFTNEPEQMRKIFIGGLSYKTSDEGLRGYYSQWGELLDCVVMTDKNTGKSRGFGFVTYGSCAMVDEAMKNRPHVIDGRTVQPKRAVPREESNSSGANVTVNKIFIGGIRDKPVTKDDLDEYFGRFGNIVDCVIMVEKETNKPRGFAFVEFDDYDPVDQIILRKHHSINGVKIDVKKAIPRDNAGGEPSGRGGRGGPRGGGRGGNRGAKRAATEAFEQSWNQGMNPGPGAGYNPNMGFNDQHGGYGQQQQNYNSAPTYNPHEYQQQMQGGYPAAYGSNQDFGQNYAQSYGGGAMKAPGGGGARSHPY